MTKVRRHAMTLSLLLVLVLAAPASAATWRTLGTAKAQGHAGEGQNSFSALYVGGRDVSEIQIGFKVYKRARTVAYDYSVYCWHNGNAPSKSRTGLSESVEPGGWHWVTVWARATKNVCDTEVSTVLGNYGSATVKTRVRVR